MPLIRAPPLPHPTLSLSPPPQIAYCSSDAWVGDAAAASTPLNATTNAAGAPGWAFKGQRIIQATLAVLSEQLGLGSAPGTRVLLGGCAAGARGAMATLDYLPAMLPPGVQVRPATPWVPPFPHGVGRGAAKRGCALLRAGRKRKGAKRTTAVPLLLFVLITAPSSSSLITVPHPPPYVSADPITPRSAPSWTALCGWRWSRSSRGSPLWRRRRRRRAQHTRTLTHCCWRHACVRACVRVMGACMR